MKILYVSSYYPTIGGAEKYLHELCSIFSEKHEVFILCPNIKGNTTKEPYKVIRAATLLRSPKIVKKFFPLEYVQNYSFIIPAIIKGKKVIKKEGVDVIHVQFGLAFGIIGYFLKKITKKPLILTLHGAGILGLTGFKRFFKPVIKKVLNNSNRIIAVSDEVKKEARKLTNNKIDLIYNGIFIKKFYNGGDKNFVLGVGILTKRKGFDYLIKAASDKRLRNIKFIIIGDGPEKENLNKLASELKLKNVNLVGPKPHEKVRQMMSQCSLFVLPSNLEAFGLVLIEAMACSKPVIGTKVGGIKEIIIDGKNGFLVNSKSPTELTKSVEKILSNKSLKNKMGKMSRKIVEKKFDWEIAAKKIEQIYFEIKKGSKRKFY